MAIFLHYAFRAMTITGITPISRWLVFLHPANMTAGITPIGIAIYMYCITPTRGWLLPALDKCAINNL